jgi:hypothetical protein
VVVCSCAGKTVFRFFVSELSAVSLILSPFGNCNPRNTNEYSGTKHNSRDNPTDTDVAR